MIADMDSETHELVRACPASEVQEGRLSEIAEGGKHFLLTRVGDELRAYRNLCKHQYLVMEGCEVEDGEFECPYHTVRYSLATGEVSDDSGFMGVEALTRYATQLKDGEVWLEVPKKEKW